MNKLKKKVKEACTVHFSPFTTNTIFINIKVELLFANIRFIHFSSK